VELARETLDILAHPVHEWERSTKKLEMKGLDIYSREFICAALPETLFMLQERNMLPAIAFSFDRKFCEFMAASMVNYFRHKEKEWKNGSAYKSALEKFNESERQKTKILKDKNRRNRGNLVEEVSLLEAISPANMSGPRTTFTTPGEVFDRHTLRDEIEQLGDSVSSGLKEALRRGIGVHHSGLNKKYLQLTERLFRARHLKIVFATGTLALGINMPCKTTIFVDDSNYLTPIEYRQMSGRAGRRGFDPIGNVVFFSVPPHKIRKLESSKLATIRGHFLYTTSYLLRSLALAGGVSRAASVENVADLYRKKPKVSIQAYQATSSTNVYT
jgi:ATP-dependent RNA helicase DDX60